MRNEWPKWWGSRFYSFRIIVTQCWFLFLLLFVMGLSF